MERSTIENLGLPSSLNERFEFLRLLGKGGVGVVLHAKDAKLARTVAVKFLLPTILGDETFVRRFSREAVIAKRLDHPSIIRALDEGMCEEWPFIVYEYASGGSLQKHIETKGTIPFEEAMSLILSIGEGLSYAHEQGIIHRDIKPDNILLLDDGRPAISDFGLAFVMEQVERLTKTGIFLGTPRYMAPEQIEGRVVDGRCDLYALASLAFFLFSGKHPFYSRDVPSLLREKLRSKPLKLKAVAKDIPMSVARVIDRGLNGDPTKRQNTVSTFLGELRNAAEDKQTRTQESIQTIRLERPVKKAPNTSSYLFKIAAPLIFLLLALAYFVLATPDVTVKSVTVDSVADGAFIQWRSNVDTKSELLYGIVGSTQSEHLASHNGPTSKHGCTLTCLTPNSTYRYRLRLGKDEWSPPRTFNTKPFDITHFGLVPNGRTATSIIVSVTASSPCSAEISVYDPKTEELFYTQPLPGRQRKWKVKLNRIPPKRLVELTLRAFLTNGHEKKATYRAATKPEDCETVCSKVMFKKIAFSPAFLMSSVDKKVFSTKDPSTGHLYCSAEKRGLRCIDSTNGKEQWKMSKPWSLKEMAVHNGRLYAIDKRKRHKEVLCCFRCSDGKVVWRRTLKNGVFRHRLFPTAAGLIVVFKNGTSACYFYESGKTRWTNSNKELNPKLSSLGVKGRLWVATKTDEVFALDPATGIPIKETRLQFASPLTCPPLENNGHLYVGLGRGLLFAYTLSTKQPVMRLDLQSRLRSIKNSNGILYVLTSWPTFNLCVIDPTQKRLLWRHKTNMNITGGPTIRRDSVYIIARTNPTETLRCLDGRSGRTIWEHHEYYNVAFGLYAEDDSVLFCTAHDVIKRIRE